MRGIFTEADRLFLKVRNQFEMLASTPLKWEWMHLWGKRIEVDEIGSQK